jgi:hypothetical protein
MNGSPNTEKLLHKNNLVSHVAVFILNLLQLIQNAAFFFGFYIFLLNDPAPSSSNIADVMNALPF